MKNMILLTALSGKELFVDKRRIYAICDKVSYSEVFVGNERFSVNETPEMIFEMADLSND